MRVIAGTGWYPIPKPTSFVPIFDDRWCLAFPGLRYRAVLASPEETLQGGSSHLAERWCTWEGIPILVPGPHGSDVHHESHGCPLHLWWPLLFMTAFCEGRAGPGGFCAVPGLTQHRETVKPTPWIQSYESEIIERPGRYSKRRLG